MHVVTDLHDFLRRDAADDRLHGTDVAGRHMCEAAHERLVHFLLAAGFRQLGVDALGRLQELLSVRLCGGGMVNNIAWVRLSSLTHLTHRMPTSLLL